MYNFKEIEKKWQKHWDDNKSFHAVNGGNKEKYYILTEFPYPSGSGLHVGHPRSYTALDSLARKRRLEGYNVLLPMGWDAFGLPAENYAIANKIHPKEAVRINIDTFKSQLKSLGISFDWDREISTCDPEYYKWTQWQFLKFFEHGLAYKSKKTINWCTSCKVGLANEEVEKGKCERCGGEVVKKEKEQWMLGMRSYADKLIEGLEETNFIDRVKTAQINWIGRSEGAEVDFPIENSNEKLRIFTTRPDTIYGVTFMVISPEHPIINTLKDKITNYKEVEQYKLDASKKSEFERVELTKEKTGVKLEGINAINPINNEKVQVWVADYVMMGYGTGAIMAVPAHDERDYEFAKKFNIPIIQVIAPTYKETGKDAPRSGVENTKRTIVCVILKHHTEDKYLYLNWEKQGWKSFVAGGIEENETVEEAATKEIKEETGYQNIIVDKVSNFYFYDSFYAAHKNVNREVNEHIVYAHIKDDEKEEIDKSELEQHIPIWVSKNDILNIINKPNKECVEWIFPEEKPYIGEGIMINSGILNGINNKKDSIKKMVDYIEEKGYGKKSVNYRLQDWIFSRQRFWGEPIPMIYCDDCGWVPVPEKDLPVVLPDVAMYEPTDNGDSPLANISEWYTTTCPKCDKPARRETDTMPNWAGSSWYWLRYMDPHNENVFADRNALDYWGKVDWYNGGMEHATRHLLYARFWHRFLYDIGLVPTKEPFILRTAHGMVLGENGEKMSKSRGNVVNPNDVVRDYGADALRAYEMFMGDYELDTAWSTNGLKGCKRFLDRLWRIQEKVVEGDNYSKELEVNINKTIKKVGYDIENMKYNTAISALMTLLNQYEELDNITKEDLKVFITLLNPIAPHITEEINELNNLGEPLYKSSWPTYDESKTIDESYELVVQVNGKVRGKIEVETSMNEEKMKEIALQNENVKRFIEGLEIVKIITIPKKLVNIVVK